MKYLFLILLAYAGYATMENVYEGSGIFGVMMFSSLFFIFETVYTKRGGE